MRMFREIHKRIQDAKAKEYLEESNHPSANLNYRNLINNDSSKQIKKACFNSYFYVKQCVKALFILFAGAIPEDFVMNIARNISANYRSAPQALYISQNSMNFWRLVAAGVFLYSIYLVIYKLDWIPCKHLGYIKKARFIEKKQLLHLRVQGAKRTLHIKDSKMHLKDYKKVPHISHMHHSGARTRDDNK